MGARGRPGEGRGREGGGKRGWYLDSSGVQVRGWTGWEWSDRLRRALGGDGRREGTAPGLGGPRAFAFERVGRVWGGRGGASGGGSRPHGGFGFAASGGLDAFRLSTWACESRGEAVRRGVISPRWIIGGRDGEGRSAFVRWSGWGACGREFGEGAGMASRMRRGPRRPCLADFGPKDSQM